MKKTGKKQNDYFLAGIFLLTAFLILFFQRVIFAEEGSVVSVTKDGSVLGVYSLNENQSIPIEDKSGYNLLMIENSHAYMKEADCPDGLCLKQRPVSKKREGIICLPHRLIITVEGGEESSVDAVTY